MRTVEAVAAVFGTALLVSCSSPPDQAVPAATLSPAAVTESPSPTPTAIDTATVPAQIDVEYLQAVMDDLDAALGSVYRDAAEAGALGEEYELAMREVYTEHAAGRQSEDFREAIGLRGLAREPADPITEVIEVLEADPDCVYFTAQRDLKPLLRTPIDPVQPYYLALERGTPGERNPTAWVLSMEAFYRSGDAPASVCGGDA